MSNEGRVLLQMDCATTRKMQTSTVPPAVAEILSPACLTEFGACLADSQCAVEERLEMLYKKSIQPALVGSLKPDDIQEELSLVLQKPPQTPVRSSLVA